MEVMDVNEEQVLISLRDMRNCYEEPVESGHAAARPCPIQPAIKASLPWLDLRVFYVKVSKCVLLNDNSTPEYLTLNHVPLNRDTLLEVNCVRTSIHSDGVSILLKRDRLDKRSDEVTFVNTDSIRMAGPTKFEVFHDDVLVLSGALELCCSNGCGGELKHQGPSWSMSCESDVYGNNGVVKGTSNNQNQYVGVGVGDCASPGIEVYVAGSFSGSPIVLTRGLQLSKKRQVRKGMLESIPEYEATQTQKGDSSTLTIQSRDYPAYKQQEEGHNSAYWEADYLDGEDGELSWFNAGVRVGVGIGLGICLGVGVGVGLLVRSYQGTTKNFRRRLL